jgi:dihydropyrimidine dehydrogenase (NAD+) subunit PreT
MAPSGPLPGLTPRPERRATPPGRPLARVYPERPTLPAREPAPRRWAFKLFLVTLAAICLVGWPYYASPMAQRVRSPLHPWLRPSGYIGQSAGLLALVIFIFLWLYPVRKKFRRLAFTGTIARWLDVHVLSALGLPVLVAIHAAWRFTGLIGLGFWSMMVVWLSGLAGRYIYARIPRSRQGVELTIEQIAARRRELLEEIARASGLDANLVETTLSAGQGPLVRRGLWGSLWRMIADDFARRRAARRLRRLWEGRSPRRRKHDRQMLRAVQRLARREMALAQQARMLDATHDVFRYWHVLHRPVAVAALIAVLIHVAVVVAVGATWLW